MDHRRRLSLMFHPRKECSGRFWDFDTKYKELWQDFICKQWSFYGKNFPQGRPSIACLFWNKAIGMKTLVWVNHLSYYKSTLTENHQLISLTQKRKQKKQNRERSKERNESIFWKFLCSEKSFLIFVSNFLSEILSDLI